MDQETWTSYKARQRAGIPLTWLEGTTQNYYIKMPSHDAYISLREVRVPPCNGFSISTSSIRNILRNATYVWKTSRRSKAVIYTPLTAIAFINYSHAFCRQHEKTGASEHIKMLIFGDESTYTY